MNKNTILLLALVAGAAYMMKNAGAANRPAGSASAPAASKNVNDQMWSSLLGNGWKMLRDAQNSDGSEAFIKRNFLGQITTSDGKPVGSELADLLPSTYMTEQPVDLTAASDGVDYLNDSISALGW